MIMKEEVYSSLRESTKDIQKPLYIQMAHCFISCSSRFDVANQTANFFGDHQEAWRLGRHCNHRGNVNQQMHSKLQASPMDSYTGCVHNSDTYEFVLPCSNACTVQCRHHLTRLAELACARSELAWISGRARLGFPSGLLGRPGSLPQILLASLASDSGFQVGDVAAAGHTQIVGMTEAKDAKAKHISTKHIKFAEQESTNL
jgi:hypothetical protein